MTEKKFLIIDSRPYGLFSIFLHTIDNIKWAEDNGYIPVVRWGPGRVDVNYGRPGAELATKLVNPSHVGDSPNFLTPSFSGELKKSLYCLKDESPWHYFFDQINEYSIDVATDGNHVVSDIFQVGFHDLGHESLEEKFLIFNLHSYTPLNIVYHFYLDKFSESIENHKNGSLYRHRVNVNSYIKKYIKVKEEINSKVNSFADKHFSDFVIGVHIRGTDKKSESKIGQRPFITIDDYINCIKKTLNKKPSASIFVASDNNEAIKKIFKTFSNNKIIVYNCTRMSSYNSDVPIHLSSFAGPQAGKEALIDCLLLSKCDHVICTDSNLSAASLYFNPENSCTFVNKIGDTQ